MKMRNTAVAACVFLFVNGAYAGVHSNFPKTNTDQIVLGVNGNQYLVSDTLNQPLPDRRSNNFGLDFSAREKAVGNTLDGAFDIDAQIGLTNSNYKYFNPNEFYFGSSAALSPEYSVHMGRKVEEWNSLDEEWSLGLFQPRFRWDYLNERTSGLTGFFGAIKKENYSLTLFASPIFLPEQGAPQNFANGSCTSGSPWFYCPSNSITLFNQTTPVKMNLQIPPLRELIAYAGGGASFYLGKTEGLYWRNSVAYKPMNQLFLSYEGKFDLSTQQLPAVIHPRVLYHTLYSTEFGYKENHDKYLLSVIKEDPHRDYTPPQWNTQEASPATLFGAILSLDLVGEGKSATHGEFSYLYRDGGNSNDKGPFAATNGSLFEPLYSFKNAYSLQIKSPIKKEWAPYFQGAFHFIADANNQGNILMLDTIFQPLSRLNFGLGFDMLGSNSASAVDFISRYQRNDRLRGGLHYYF